MKENTFALPAHNWTPYPFQLKAWNAMVREDFRRAYLCWPRRHGKDSIAGHLLAIKAMQRVGNYAIMFPQINTARRAIWEGLSHLNIPRIDEFFPSEIVTKKDSQSQMLWLSSGSTIQLLGSDSYQSSIGSSFTGIVYSEAALTTLEASQYLRPMIERNKGFEVFISTPRGKNHFYRGLLGAQEDMRNGVPGIYAEHIKAENAGIFTPADLLRIRMDYIRDMGQVSGQATFSQEFDSSFEAALIGSVWGAELEEMQLEGRVAPFPHNRRYPVITSWDLGINDSTVILLWQEINGRYILIDAVEQSGIGLDTYIRILKQKAQEMGYMYGQHFAPHDIAVRDYARGVSRIDEAKRMGLTFTRTPQTRLKTQIAAGAQLLRQVCVNSESPTAMQALERFKGWRYPANKATGQLVDTPLHDENSHAASALCTYAVQMAKKLGVPGYSDVDLHPDSAVLGGGQKFDPRNYGPAPYSHEGSVSNVMRAHAGHAPTRGAFG
jgi:phage terminase large subunit